jgi:integrase
MLLSTVFCTELPACRTGESPMARRSSVRYWRSRHAYCCWFDGTQHVLAEGPDDFPCGPTYQAALQKFTEITALSNADSAKDRNTCRVVCELYLRWISTRRKEHTVAIRQKIFVPFTDALGEVTVKDLTQHMVYAWFDQMREWRRHPGTGHPTRWTDGSVRNACTSLQAAFNWAARSGLITRNPLTGLEQPPARSRGREALLGRTPEERRENHRKILAACTPALRRVLVCLEATGARPGELMNATAADFDAELGAIVYHADDKRLEKEFRHKTAGKGKDRVIFLSGEALELIKALVKKHPKGPLFLTEKGRRLHKHLGRSGWTNNTLTERIREIRKEVGMPCLTPYSYRHTFATEWLEQGRSVDLLAELLGNSPAVIRKHYSHLLGDAGNLRRQLEAFRAASGAGRQTPKDPAAGGEE